MTERKEHEVIESCKARFESEELKSGDKSKSVSGLMMELYEFRTDIGDNSSQTPKHGRLFRPTSMDQVVFVKGLKNKFGHIQMNVKRRKKGVDVKVWTKERAEVTEMKRMIDAGVLLKHEGILKPISCADSNQVSKLVITCENYDYTLQEWLDSFGANAIPDGDYLSDQGKEIVRSGWSTIEYLWGKGYVCDDLDKPSTYVMVGRTMKILPFLIRKRLPTENDDTKLALRANFADLLDNQISRFWKDAELHELTSLMRCQYSSFELILGHPVLASPEQRQLMYRIAYYRGMPPAQLTALNAIAPFDSTWVQEANKDAAFRNILKNSTFSLNVEGAMHFATVASCHYLQCLKAENPNWNGPPLPSDHVDRQLKHVLPLLLCKRYALKGDAAFSSKSVFQL